MDNKDYIKLENMPKVELHVHLDGSLNINSLAHENNIPIEELNKKMMADETCNNLNDYLEKFDYPISILQTKEALDNAIYELVFSLKQQNIIYAEIRFAPAFHTKEGLTQEEVVQAVVKGLSRYDNNYNLILCCMRNLDLTTNKETIDIARKYLGHKVCAVDLAGAEALYPTENYGELFEYAKENRVPFTIHAGEADGPQSVESALNFGAKRIGHGVRSIEDRDLLDKIITNNITLEVCPTSNIQTRVVKDIFSHPIYELYKLGAKVTINTDNMTVSNTNLLKEYIKLKKAFDLNLEDFKTMNINSINAAFISQQQKDELIKEIEKYN